MQPGTESVGRRSDKDPAIPMRGIEGPRAHLSPGGRQDAKRQRVVLQPEYRGKRHE